MTYQRIVCFKFKKGVDSEDIQRHMQDFKNLKKCIPQILSYEGGKTVPGDYGAVSEYDCMHYLTFVDDKDIDDYFNHEEHRNFIKRNESIWEKALVINSVIDV